MLAAALAAAALFAPDRYIGVTITSLWLVAVYVAIVFIFPNLWTIAISPAAVLGLWWFLAQAATEKLNLTNFPLMALDIQMFFANPSGLLDAINAPQVFYWLVDGLPFGIGLVILLAVYRSFQQGRLASAAARIPWRLAKLGLASVGFLMLFNASVSSISSYIKLHDDDFGVWSDDGLAKFASFLGVVPFIIYSEHVEAGGTKNFLTYKPVVPPPTTAKVLASASKFLNFSKIKQHTLPNIMLIHAESAFDPNDVFNLSSTITNELFYTSPLRSGEDKVHFRGPGLANIIGGGSWVSEFEVINGIDSRLFGISGRYTHASLSAYSHNSLVRYLKTRGYHTSITTPDSPLFYNSGVAFKRYGFDRVNSKTGSYRDDLATMSAVLSLDTDYAERGPFLKYVMLVNNHAPHWCDDAFKSEYGTENFSGDPSGDETCALREYARRARLIERAIGDAKAYLEGVQAKTGRPYVIAIYGDHQPFSFTGNGPVQVNMGLKFDRFRKDKSKRKTILELISSAENPFSWQPDKPAPLTLLPSMISAYVAQSPTQLYLPENFYQYDHCGSDMIGQLTGASFYGGPSEGEHHLCSSFDEVVAALKNSNVISETSSLGIALAANRQNTQESCPASTITVAATGSHFKGAPEITVAVDGMDIDHFPLEDDSLAGSVPLQIDKNPTAPTRQIKLQSATNIEHIEMRFTNDQWEGDGKDRNVNIHLVKFNKTTLSSKDVTFSSPDVGWVNPNGVIQLFRNGSAIFKGPFMTNCP